MLLTLSPAEAGRFSHVVHQRCLECSPDGVSMHQLRLPCGGCAITPLTLSLKKGLGIIGTLMDAVSGLRL